MVRSLPASEACIRKEAHVGQSSPTRQDHKQDFDSLFANKLLIRNPDLAA